MPRKWTLQWPEAVDACAKPPGWPWRDRATFHRPAHVRLGVCSEIELPLNASRLRTCASSPVQQSKDHSLLLLSKNSSDALLLKGFQVLQQSLSQGKFRTLDHNPARVRLVASRLVGLARGVQETNQPRPLRSHVPEHPSTRAPPQPIGAGLGLSMVNGASSSSHSFSKGTC